jgi:hypothetical protein
MQPYTPQPITNRKRAEWKLEQQRINGFAIDLAGDYHVWRDTPSMWRLVHRTTPMNDFVAVGSVSAVLNAWEQRKMHTRWACDCGLLNEKGRRCECGKEARP